MAAQENITGTNTTKHSTRNNKIHRIGRSKRSPRNNNNNNNDNNSDNTNNNINNTKRRKRSRSNKCSPMLILFGIILFLPAFVNVYSSMGGFDDAIGWMSSSSSSSSSERSNPQHYYEAYFAPILTSSYNTADSGSDNATATAIITSSSSSSSLTTSSQAVSTTVDSNQRVLSDTTVTTNTTNTTTSTNNKISLSSSSSSPSSSSFPSSSSSSSRDHLIQEALFISRERLMTRVPAWTMEFFDWQQAQLQTLNEHNWKDGTKFRFLILRCGRFDRACGGFTDRLKPLPLLLRLAYEGKRIFMIRWEKPYPLEEFLIPTPHFNWSVPSYMNESLLHYGGFEIRKRFGPNWNKLWNQNKKTEFLLRESKSRTPIVIEVKKQIHDGGVELYGTTFQFNATSTTTSTTKSDGTVEESYQSMYHGLFRGLFQPHPAVEKIVKQQWDKYNLTPTQYAVAHSRSFYKVEMAKVHKRVIRDLAINVVNCASMLGRGRVIQNNNNNHTNNNNGPTGLDSGPLPIYFASDSSYASQIIHDYAKAGNYKVYTNAMQNKTNEDPLHLDFAGRGNKTWPVSAFYDSIVDMLVLGNARCVSYGKGGYGAYSSMLSFDANCRFCMFEEEIRKGNDGLTLVGKDGKPLLFLVPKRCTKFIKKPSVAIERMPGPYSSAHQRGKRLG